MKRYSEKATREALADGLRIRQYDDPMRGPVYRVMEGNDVLGWITFDLYLKLKQEGAIERIEYGFMWQDYAAPAPAPEANPFGLEACVDHIRSFEVETMHRDAPEVMAQLLHCEDVNGSMFNRTMWKAFDVVFPEFPVSLDVAREIYAAAADFDGKVSDLDRVARNIREYAQAIIWEEYDAAQAAQEQPQEAPQPEPKSEDEENREYAQRVAQEVERYYRGYLRRCPCCEAIVERDDWDNLDVFTCPHCDDLDDVGQWEPLSLYDYLSDVLDVTYIVGSDRQTLKGARFYVTLGGPSVWLDTCSRSVELRWGGRSASWGLSFALCDELDEIAQDWWDLG